MLSEMFYWLFNIELFSSSLEMLMQVCHGDLSTHILQRVIKIGKKIILSANFPLSDITGTSNFFLSLLECYQSW
jgi:hypothetical protein